MIRITTTTLSTVSGIIVSAGLLTPPGASAQVEPGFYAIPSLTVAGVYDDNIFFENENEVDDVITRVRPGLELGYDSATFSWLGRYSFDSEKYDENSELDSWLMRRDAYGELEYLPNSQLMLTGNIAYAETQTPGELNLATGLQPGRTNAERFTINPGLVYNFGADTTASLEYILNQDKLAGGVETDFHETAAEVEHILNAAHTLLFGYSYRRYDFSISPAIDSHTPRLGWMYAFSPRSIFTLEAGPRIAGDETDLYLSARVDHEYARGQLSFAYEVDETTLIGEVGRLQNERFSASLTHNFSDRFTLTATPGYSTLDRNNADTEVYQFTAEARYRLNDALSVRASYEHNFQDADFLIGTADQELERNVVLLGFTLTYPRPNGGETGQ